MVSYWIFALFLVVESRDIPPSLKNGDWDPYGSELARARVNTQLRQLQDDDSAPAWELSGLFEGDLLEDPTLSRNGVIDRKRRWANGIIPYFIHEEQFTKKQQMIIMNVFTEYHSKTCIRFRPYKKSDKDWVEFQSKSVGCWAKVGKKFGGRVINLHRPNCLRNGTVIHELMHIIGFHHQQSSSDRDEYVHIFWENIKKDHRRNFKKYNDATVTDLGVGYDYDSVMHYSSTAFSRNGKVTIVPLWPGVTLARKKGLSPKDALKINRMYESRCRRRDRAHWAAKPWEFVDHYKELLRATNDFQYQY